jgi:DNA-binding FadR family transcriptional regulator
VQRRDGEPTVLELTRALILDRYLRAGDRLPSEHDLAAEIGASRNSVREALRGLEAQGIVEIRHGSGIYLRDMTLAGLADILTFWGQLSERDGIETLRPIAQVREVLETNLVHDVVPLLTSDDLRTLSVIVRDMEARAEEGEYAADADRRFHDALYRPLDNWVLTYLLQAFWEAFANVNRPRDSRPPAEVVAQQHRDILEALKRRDADAAAEALHQHFDNILHDRS